ncbi:hypothetical protein [Burkholderia sp. AU6039]|uniref:hypothetical protein n=1 Tax=Burkholderia sp. AU6039 TaxID=2015344 RepID=UPI00117ED5A0|nr:hypothetical protein [Burkholderia sp. AU6039]
MSFELEIGVGRHCTLYSANEYCARFPTGTPGEKTGKAFIGSAVASDLARNKEQLSSLSNFLRDCRVASAAHDVAEPMRLLHGLQRAVTGGDVVAVVEPLRSIGVPGPRSEERLRPRSITLTPSQLFGRVTRATVDRFAPVLARRKLPAEDGIAVWFANPGDVLPDGTIATALGNAQPFPYVPGEAVGDAIEIASANRGEMFACDVISAECKGSVLREFPSQYLGVKLDDIQSDARNGVKDARKALKLLNDNRFKK